MKYNGTAGFSSETPLEISPGVFQYSTITRKIKGDVLQYRYSNVQNAETTNDNINTNNRLSIVADKYMQEFIGQLLWVSFLGKKWRVASFTYNKPRFILELGGLYNESYEPSNRPSSRT